MRTAFFITIFTLVFQGLLSSNQIDKIIQQEEKLGKEEKENQAKIKAVNELQNYGKGLCTFTCVDC